MLLRDHPLITYKGNRSWPPSWLWSGGNDTTKPKGEVGILKDVIPSNVEPYDRCFLIMEHLGAEYIGALLLSDTAFCQEIFGILAQNRGKTIQEIVASILPTRYKATLTLFIRTFLVPPHRIFY